MRDWARRVLGQDPLFVDTETTGVDRWDEVVQIGVVMADEAVALDCLVRPVRQTRWPGAERVHGIGPADVAGQPTIEGYLDVLGALLKDRMVVAYNADFDRRLLTQSCRAAGVPDLARLAAAWVDVMAPYARFWGEPSPLSGWLPVAEAGRRLPAAGGKGDRVSQRGG